MAVTKVKGLSTEILVVPRVDTVHLVADNRVNITIGEDIDYTAVSETTARYYRELI